MTTHNVGALVNRQMRRWEIQQPRADAPGSRPCVAISRLPWARGSTVGRLVAEQLDYGFFGREILEAIAAEKGIRQRILDGLDEQVLSKIERFVADLLHLRSLSESEYLKQVMRTVTTLGRRGSAVIVGRGGAFILPAERALRVLVVAPAAIRAARLAEAEGLTAVQAEKRLAELDAKRREFARYQFGVEQSDPVRYDLVLNTGTISLEAAADLVLGALAARFGEAKAGAQPTTASR